MYRTNTIKKGRKSAYGKDVDTMTSTHYAARQKRTDYALSLINPEAKLNVRIPDMACYPTVAYTTELHQPITINNGTSTDNNQMLHVVLHGLPYIRSFQGQNGSVPGGLSTGATAQNGYVGTIASIGANYKATRVVSAMAKLTFAGDDTKTQGSIFGTFLPHDWAIKTGVKYSSTVGDNPDIGYSTDKWMGDIPDYYQGPLKQGVITRYKPVDGHAWDMTPIDASDTSLQYGTFLFLINPEATITTTTFMLDIVVNYEGIVKHNDTGLIPAVSGADPGALAHGINSASKTAIAFPSTNAGWMKNVDLPLRSVV